ncbi:SH3 domain-containing protein [Parerythrobacter lacustris]|uniref:SH3 domain-containing protein n=1 Tax=Parerythrobacter lacustris TaxID=2969984 RepID=A0ABT1XS01_9SPHN|nr:SH3 domain-containing protein [Parerythrobacter lacustris]MCR2833716.1 SH3 domain-containing protein [Parerythrobacter lacustris]
MTMRILAAALILLAALATPGSAQDREVPYWATIKTDELNMRVGPSVEYKIAWVYKRKGLPVKVIRVVEGWRLIRDHDGDEGWVTANLLSAERGGLVVGEGLVAMRESPSSASKLRWNAQPGVVGKLGECEAGWCRFDVAGRAGWVEAGRLWGAGEP